MEPNPYKSSEASENQPEETSREWMTWAGVSCLVAAGIGVVATVLRMMAAYDSISAVSSTVRPDELASAISNSLVFTVLAVPFGVAGIVLMILGVSKRKAKGD